MRKFYKNLLLSITLVTVASSTTLTAAEAQTEAQSIVVNQGDRILIGNSSSCTAGYIDNKAGTLLTAAHCGSPGEKVYVKNSLGIYKNIGVMEGNPNYNTNHYRNDFAYVKLNSGVTGENIYSGDTRITPEDVEVGDRFCSIGASSPVLKCGVVRTVNDKILISNREGGGIKGDSGGPGWIPGKGFFGVYSFFFGGENKYPTKNTKYNGTAFTYPGDAETEEYLYLSTNDISFPAPKILDPKEAKPITNTTTQNPPTTKNDQSGSSSLSSNNDTSSSISDNNSSISDTDNSSISSSDKVPFSTAAIAIGSLVVLSGIAGIFTNGMQGILKENPQFFNINYWMNQIFKF